MKKINGVISGIASLFSDTSSNILEKYPSTYEKDVTKSLENGWNNVGMAIRGKNRQIKSKLKKCWFSRRK